MINNHLETVALDLSLTFLFALTACNNNTLKFSQKNNHNDE